jgi:uncharacterized protein YndB with AHSA1/START domain
MTVPQPINTTARSQAESISFEFDLPHAPEKVWRALTNPALLAEWLLPVIGFKLEPGAAFSFKAPPQPGWDGVVNCRMREIEAQRTISWAWVVGDIDTVVTFTIAPTGGVGEGAGRTGTRLSIVQSGFKPHQKQAFGGAQYGWRMMGGRLVDLLARMP